MSTVAEKATQKQVLKNIDLLSFDQQKEIAEYLNKRLRMSIYKEFNDSVEPNNYTMEDIVAITKEVRREHDKNEK